MVKVHTIIAGVISIRALTKVSVAEAEAIDTVTITDHHQADAVTTNRLIHHYYLNEAVKEEEEGKPTFRVFFFWYEQKREAPFYIDTSQHPPPFF